MNWPTLFLLGAAFVNSALALLPKVQTVQQVVTQLDGQLKLKVQLLPQNGLRQLTLILRRDSSIFADNHVLVAGGVEYQQAADFTYSGHIEGFPNSLASGSVLNNEFNGHIYLNKQESYFIEDGRRLFGPEYCSNGAVGSCSVMYAEDDLGSASHSHRHVRSTDTHQDYGLGMCGWHSPAIREELESILQQEVKQNDNVAVREKRQASGGNGSASGTGSRVCGLFMQADPILWNLYLKNYKMNAQQARSAIMKYFSDLVNGMNRIFGGSTFKGDSTGPFTGFSFVIRRSAIYTNDSICGSNPTDTILAQLCKSNLDSSAVLDINSQLDHSTYCLAYLFSHRQFTQGVQGLAWIGYPNSYPGGVCDRRRNTKSYNTGIVTSNNYGEQSALNNLILTFTHEVGHNFGSAHDPDGDSTCQPGDNGQASGNFIMYPYVTPGNQANNQQFSTCSGRSIAANLQDVIGTSASKTNCFISSSAALCGNGVVEGSEECDCGYAGDCTNKCCVPVGDSSGRECKLAATAVCSPGPLAPCCDANTCGFATTAGTICLAEGECSYSVACSGTSAQCPLSGNQTYKPDGTSCWRGSRVCATGQCTASRCTSIKDGSGAAYSECQETLTTTTQDTGKLCYMSCKSPTSTTCSSSLNVNQAGFDTNFRAFLQSISSNKTNIQPIQMSAGSPCGNNKGYCDVFSKCRMVNAQGALAKIIAYATGKQKPQTVSQWLVAYWWVIAIVAALIVAIAMFFIRICAVACPTSNPKRHKRHSVKNACTCGKFGD